MQYVLLFLVLVVNFYRVTRSYSSCTIILMHSCFNNRSVFDLPLFNFCGFVFKVVTFYLSRLASLFWMRMTILHTLTQIVTPSVSLRAQKLGLL